MKMQGDLPGSAWSDYSLPDATGHFGPYGGVFVAETLRQALAWGERRRMVTHNPAAIAELPRAAPATSARCGRRTAVSTSRGELFG